MDDGLRREHFQRCHDEIRVLFQCEERKRVSFILFCHLRAFENVQELELYSVETGAEAGQPGDGFQHIFPGLPGQPEDDVNNDSDFALFEAFVGIFEDRECVAPVESMSGAFMDGLETQLYPDRLYTVQVGEHVEDLIRQTVRPGADGDCGNLRKGGCFEEEIPKARRIAIGICEGLEVGDVSALIFRDPGGDLGIYPASGPRDLLCDGGGGFREISGTALRAEGTATVSERSVPVRAGAACREGELIYFCPEGLLQMIGE